MKLYSNSEKKARDDAKKADAAAISAAEADPKKAESKVKGNDYSNMWGSDNGDSAAPEKVMDDLNSPHAKMHTTFYGQHEK